MVHDFEVGVLPRHSQDLVQVFPRRGWGAGGRGCERPGGGGSPQPLSGRLQSFVIASPAPTNPRIENRAQSLEKVWWPLKTCSCTSAALHWPPPTPPSAGGDLWDPSFFVSGLLRPLVSQTGHRLQNFYIRMIFFSSESRISIQRTPSFAMRNIFGRRFRAETKTRVLRGVSIAER